MKITCNREQLLQAFQAVAAVAPTRSPKPILQNVKLEVTADSASFLATDLEVAIRYQATGIEVEQPGACILPTARFGQILRESSDETFHIEADDKHIRVRGERSQFNLSAEDPGDYPSIAVFDDASYYETAARWFKELIRRTVFATDNESSRYALGGVKMEWEDGTLTGVGTDGRRLSKMEGPVSAVGEPGAFGDATIVPSRSLNLIDRAVNDDDGEVQIAIRQNEMLVRSPRAMIYSRLLEGRFPRWRDVFPQRTSSVKVELPIEPFYRAVRQAAILTSDESRGVDFTFGEGSLVLSGHAAEVGESRIELPVAFDSSEITITLDPRFVIDFLKVLDSDKSFTLDLQDGESAAVCTTDDGYGYVIMPLARDR
ncbi:DNA polymerase III subunit beta [Posidoniimonas corsicana]|uniref:Beta sliding clamp n=1 Tax=Posidoniimonas corsicana TaxID=1938618 RepID=A0A5C5V0V1_9BACT|nr:DNA polymerase III subunit beta [Posidoniimonas corsicana]TWT32274.1 DNA polymerase III subunit beta [Posidoniimonas corsicana]